MGSIGSSSRFAELNRRRACFRPGPPAQISHSSSSGRVALQQRSGHVTAGQVMIGEVRAGQNRGRAGWDRVGQSGAGQGRAGQDGAEQDRTGQDIYQVGHLPFERRRGNEGQARSGPMELRSVKTISCRQSMFKTSKHHQDWPNKCNPSPQRDNTHIISDTT